MRSTTAILAALLAFTLTPALVAQDEDERDPPRRARGGLREVSEEPHARRKGFWAALTVGGGGESFDANDGLGWSDREGGGMLSVKLGGTVNPSLLLGGEVNVWGREDYQGLGYDRFLSNVMFIAQWYPSRRGDFWVRGGIGVAQDELRFYDTFGGYTTVTEEGGGVALGIGYDIRVGRKVSITPTLDFWGQHYDSHDERVASLGVGVTFH